MSSGQEMDIVYTIVDEAPELASGSLLPIIKAFTSSADIKVGSRDISLAGRILSVFPDHLLDSQRQTDDLEALSYVVKTPLANVIKLPNISASIPQLKAAIDELQQQGFAVPDYPDVPSSDQEKEIRKKYDSIKGSAVNPVLREGNSDRRAAKAVKEFAKANPHSMGVWEANSKTHVASMSGDDFYANERSITASAMQAGAARIEFTSLNGESITLKDEVPVSEGAVVDATFLSVRALRAFLVSEIDDAKHKNILFSLHLKATMMKVSDPILFGHTVTTFLAPIFEKYARQFEELGVNPNAGLGDVLNRLSGGMNVFSIS